MTHRAALIGCGRIGTEFADDPRIKGVYTHAGAYMACPRTELVAVCDIDAPKASRCGRRWGVAGVYTNGILHNGSHWFDLARWLIGDMDRVQGFGVERHAGVDPTLDVWLRFETGPTGFLQGCRAQQFTIFEMDVVGSYGRMRLVESGHRVELFDVGDNPYYSGYRSLRKVEELCV